MKQNYQRSPWAQLLYSTSLLTLYPPVAQCHIKYKHLYSAVVCSFPGSPGVARGGLWCSAEVCGFQAYRVFIKNETKVAWRMSGIEWRVVYIRQLIFETNNEKFSLGRVKSKKINGEEICCTSVWSWATIQSYEDIMRKKLSTAYWIFERR